jgi:hypothetical protein
MRMGESICGQRGGDRVAERAWVYVARLSVVSILHPVPERARTRIESESYTKSGLKSGLTRSSPLLRCTRPRTLPPHRHHRRVRNPLRQEQGTTIQVSDPL